MEKTLFCKAGCKLETQNRPRKWNFISQAFTNCGILHLVALIILVSMCSARCVVIQTETHCAAQNFGRYANVAHLLSFSPHCPPELFVNTLKKPNHERMFFVFVLGGCKQNVAISVNRYKRHSTRKHCGCLCRQQAFGWRGDQNINWSYVKKYQKYPQPQYLCAKTRCQGDFFFITAILLSVSYTAIYWWN